MIIITGAAGFIASNLVAQLNKQGYKDLVLVDDFTHQEKKNNYKGKQYSALVEREKFFEWLDKEHKHVQFIFHIGARTNTAEFDREIFEKLNIGYTKTVWTKCVEYGLPFVYASSAATYGSGEHGYDDQHELIEKFMPLNPYGDSKNDFDKWALAQKKKPFFWAGLKFFNVYGPNEYHKGRMASVVYHAYNQIGATKKMKLFRSHRNDFFDGEQMRDFIYVKDVVDVLMFLMETRKNSGIYNLGTGKARTFLDLAKSTFAAMQLEPNIEFIDTPEDIRDKYQYFTEAKMEKLREAGYDNEFYSLEDGIRDYVVNYLTENNFN